MSTATEQDLAPGTGDPATALRLIEAGAILPAAVLGDGDGTVAASGAVEPAPGAGNDPGPGTVDTVTARRYTHPVLGDRLVVRLTPQTLGPAEDLALDFLGFTPATEPVPVGTGRRQALGFPSWALVHDPANGHHALALVKDLERLARQARTRAKAAKDAFGELGARLDRSVPHFLPTFYEQAGRAFLAADNTMFAAQMFGKAREAERVHALPVDEDRLREVFLEYALAGALSAKTLSEYARTLTARVAPERAYPLFLQLCTERVAGGLPPYTAMAKDLRRLAKAAGLDPATEDVATIRTLLDLPAVARAPFGFWKDYRAAILRLSTEDDNVRGRLLDLLPTVGEDDTETFWFDLLDAAGAFPGLTQVGDQPPVPRPADGAVGWLNRVTAWRNRGWRFPSRSARLLTLVENMVGRLRAENTAVTPLGGNGYYRADLDLIDLLLASGVPVAVPDQGRSLPLEWWFDDPGPGRRDLTALVAADWARPFLLDALTAMIPKRVGPNSDRGYLRRDDLAPLLDGAGTRDLLVTWLRQRGSHLATSALPEMAEALDLLVLVADPEVLAVEPALPAQIAGAEVGRALAATLRIGLLDEFGWPALEEATQQLSWPGKNGGYAKVIDSWPALVLVDEATAVAVGPEGILARHDIRNFPDHPRSVRRRPHAKYVDGQFLITWESSTGHVGYWSGRPQDVFPLPPLMDYRLATAEAGEVSLPLPEGGRTAGGWPLRVGDRNIAVPLPVLHDGNAWYRLEPRDYPLAAVWREYDPVTGDGGRECLPAFLENGLDAEGATLVDKTCWLVPVPAGMDGSPLGSAGGLLGWRTVAYPDGSVQGTGVDGIRADLTAEQRAALDGALPTGQRAAPSGTVPTGVLRLPDGTPVTVLRDGKMLRFTDGRTIGSVYQENGVAGRYRAGTPYLPSLPWWYALRPRDVAGSVRLRSLTDADGSALLDAADDGTGAVAADLVARVALVLPEVTHPRLLTGIAGVVKVAASCRRTLDRLRAPKPAEAPRQAAGPRIDDVALHAALSGLARVPSRNWYRRPRSGSAESVEALRTVSAALVEIAGQRVGSVAPTRINLPPDAAKVEWTVVVGGLGAVAQRAAAETTPPEHRETLLDFLDAIAATPLADQDAHWRVLQMTEIRAPEHNNSIDPDDELAHLLGQVITTADGAAVIVDAGRSWYSGSGTDRRQATAVEYSRTGQFGAIPGFTIEGFRTGGGWSGAQRVRDLVALLRERGPAPWRPAAATELAAASGLSPSAAALLLAGLPTIDSYEHNFLDPHTRRVLGLKIAEAEVAQPGLAELVTEQRLRLCAVAVPTDPAHLWETGFDIAAVATSWVAEFGKQIAVPEDLAAEASRVLAGGGMAAPRLLAGLLNPATCPWLTRDGRYVIKGDRLQQVDEESNQGALNGVTFSQTVIGLLWLAYRLPVDDPLRESLHGAYVALRERLTNPDLIIQALAEADLSGLRRVYGHPERVEGTGVEMLPLGAAGTLLHTAWFQFLFLRPALLSGPDDPLLAVTVQPTREELALALAGGLDRVLGSATTAPGPGTAPSARRAARWLQDPRVSVPDLVDRVREETGLEENSARLYLQILALPDPSEANVARWNGWTTARVRRTTVPLVEARLLVEGKRARAGRKAFLPGGWLDLKAPRMPMETWKVPLLGFTPDGKPPLGVSVPTVPLADLFTAAWDRVSSGDAPTLETLRTGRRK